MSAQFTCPICRRRQTVNDRVVCAFCGWPDLNNNPYRGSIAGDEPKRNKYNANVTERHGITFRSKGEADRYDELRLRELAGEIQHLEYEPERYPLVVNGIKVTSYRPDYRYFEDGVLVVEDFKSSATARARDWPLRKKLMLAVYGIVVREWPPKLLNNTGHRKRRKK